MNIYNSIDIYIYIYIYLTNQLFFMFVKYNYLMNHILNNILTYPQKTISQKKDL